MTNHDMKLDTIYYDLILSKKKIYETRVHDPKRQKIKLLDTVTFKDRGSQKKFKGRIIELSYFTSFEDAILDCGLKKVLPNARSVKEGVKMYESFPHDEGTYKEGAKKYGVLRMKFDIIY